MILNRRRFLSKYGLDDLNHMQQQNQAYGGGGGGGANPLKVQAVGLLHAVGYLKVSSTGYHQKKYAQSILFRNALQSLILVCTSYAGSSDCCQYHYHRF
jgi:hypothetical protein